MSFINEFNKAAAPKTMTENGAIAYDQNSISCLSRWLYNISDNRCDAVQSLSKGKIKKPFKRYSVVETDLWHDIMSNIQEVDKDILARFLVYIRDPRSGIGERSLFRSVLSELIKVNYFKPSSAVGFINAIANHGRYDDVVAIIATLPRKSKFRFALMRELCNIIKGELESIEKNPNTQISLLAKWMPSINTSSAASCAMAYQFAKILKWTPRQYRKNLATLRKAIDIVETKICQHKMHEIDYSKVPSLAMLRYHTQFLTRDRDRYREYIQSANSGEAKINMGVSTPVEIVSKMIDLMSKKTDCRFEPPEDTDAQIESLEVFWKNLKSVNVSGNILPVCDFSGSMFTNVTSNISSFDISMAMGCYISSHNTGPFKDKAITFSSESTIGDLANCNTLESRINKLKDMPMGLSTNIASVLDNVLNFAINSKCAQSEIPTLLFITDGEFDSGVVEVTETGYMDDNEYYGSLFDAYSLKYKKYGYSLPRIVFWNTQNRSKSVSMTQNENGLVLVSGFSQNIIDVIETGKSMDEAIMETINVGEFDDSRSLYE